MDEFYEDELDGVDLEPYRTSVKAGLELSEVKSNPIKSDKLKNLKKIIDDLRSLYSEYEFPSAYVDDEGNDVYPGDEEKEIFVRDEIIPHQKKLKKELIKLVKELEMDEKERMR